MKNENKKYLMHIKMVKRWKKLPSRLEDPYVNVASFITRNFVFIAKTNNLKPKNLRLNSHNVEYLPNKEYF